jgi:hypothetical protein
MRSSFFFFAYKRVENDLGLATGFFLEREGIVFGMYLKSAQNFMFKF